MDAVILKTIKFHLDRENYNVSIVAMVQLVSRFYPNLLPIAEQLLWLHFRQIVAKKRGWKLQYDLMFESKSLFSKILENKKELMQQKSELKKINPSYFNEQRNRNSKSISYKTRVLFVGASPKKFGDLGIKREAKLMQEYLESRQNKANLVVKFSLGSTFTEFTKNVNEFKPNIIVISAHSHKHGILFEDRAEPEKGVVISNAFIIETIKRSVGLSTIILNSCRISGLAKEISRNGITAGGWEGDVSISQSMAFSVSFLQFLDEGFRLEISFVLGEIISCYFASKNDPVHRINLWKEGRFYLDQSNMKWDL